MIRSSVPTSHDFKPMVDEDVDQLSSTAQDHGRFADLFKLAATVDQTPYLCVPKAIEFRADVCCGEGKVREYCFRLAREGGSAIAKAFGTEVMQNSQSASNQCCFTNVSLPLEFKQSHALHTDAQGGLDHTDGPALVKWIMDQLMNE